ncbi:MAG: hypothetical protein ACREMY_17770, partial [bacterium]
SRIVACDISGDYPQLVMRGLDPRVHRKRLSFVMMDCRVKPGNDGGVSASMIAALRRVSSPESMNFGREEWMLHVSCKS